MRPKARTRHASVCVSALTHWNSWYVYIWGKNYCTWKLILGRSRKLLAVFLLILRTVFNIYKGNKLYERIQNLGAEMPKEQRKIRVHEFHQTSSGSLCFISTSNALGIPISFPSLKPRRQHITWLRLCRSWLKINIEALYHCSHL